MKTNLDKLFKSNSSHEISGVWFDLDDKVGFLVKRFGGMNTPSIKKALASYHKPYARLIERGLLPEEKERRIYTKVFVEACLIDWKGIEIDGKETKFSNAIAVDFFTSLPELLDTLVDYAQTNTNYASDVGN